MSLPLLATKPLVPWKNIAAMRDQLSHRYFDTEHAIVQGKVADDLGPLQSAVPRLPSRAAEGQ